MTTGFAILLIIVFIITEGVYASNHNWICTLYWSGAKFTYAISRKGHLHRLILPLILHSGFAHIFWNMISLLMIGYTVEKFIGGWLRYLTLIILSGIGGNLVSATISPYSVGVGASTCLFAMVAANCVWLYYNWRTLGPWKYQTITFFGLLLLF